MFEGWGIHMFLLYKYPSKVVQSMRNSMAACKKVSQNKLQTHYGTQGLLPEMGVNIIYLGHGSNFNWSQTEKLYL